MAKTDSLLLLLSNAACVIKDFGFRLDLDCLGQLGTFYNNLRPKGTP